MKHDNAFSVSLKGEDYLDVQSNYHLLRITLLHLIWVWKVLCIVHVNIIIGVVLVSSVTRISLSSCVRSRPMGAL